MLLAKTTFLAVGFGLLPGVRVLWATWVGCWLLGYRLALHYLIKFLHCKCKMNLPAAHMSLPGESSVRQNAEHKTAGTCILPSCPKAWPERELPLALACLRFYFAWVVVCLVACVLCLLLWLQALLPIVANCKNCIPAKR